MPTLKCPLGTDCTKGKDSGVWETEDVDRELALTLLETHMKFAHSAGSHQSDGASGSSAQLPPADHLNVNKGNQGGNFVNSPMHKPTFNIHSPSGRLLRENYQIINFLGRGTYGQTFKVQPKNVHTSRVFAMKVISCSANDVERDKKEIEILKKCQHESIVSYIEDFYEENEILIITEFCSRGDLAKFIEAKKQEHRILPVDFITEWCKQLTSGVCFIHKMKIIHRDLKPANIFLTADKNLKIGDFGIAKVLDSGFASTFAGTAVYTAPEIHGGKKYNTMADLWSLGIIFFEIITYKKPFCGHDCVQKIFKEALANF